ncbi:MAG TPA: DUF58 domain-containing protein [Janthinobacterium sp.]|nr:DUF58 domain-containing protein [Janthinobacterium sp.]
MKLPDLVDMVALRGAAQGLSLRAHRPAAAQMHGPHRSARLGRGLEFEEVRLYAAGDDARVIDWRVTARRGRAHSKVYREERGRPVWIVADLHAGLYFGSRCQLKSVMLLRSAALLAWVAAMGGDRLGAVITDGGATARIVPPRAREAGVLQVLQTLVQAQPSAPGPAGPSRLALALSTLRPLVQAGSLILVLSDFAGLDQSSEDSLSWLSTRNDCRCLWLTDPLEAAGLPAGAHRVGLPGRLWWMDGDASRAAWQANWAKREQGLNNLAQRLRLPLVRLDTTAALPDALITVLKEPKWAA